MPACRKAHAKGSVACSQSRNVAVLSARQGAKFPLAIATTGRSSRRHATVGQRISAFIARVAGMAFHPVPFDLVNAPMHQRIQPLP